MKSRNKSKKKKNCVFIKVRDEGALIIKRGTRYDLFIVTSYTLSASKLFIFFLTFPVALII